MPVTSPVSENSGTAALLVGLDDEAVQKLEGPLEGRGLAVVRADASSVTKLLHFRSVEVVFARLDAAAALAELCELCADVPLVAIVPSNDDQADADALRAGAVATVRPDLTPDEVRLALDRALAGHEAPPSSADPPPSAAKRRGLLGDSEAIQRVMELISRAAPVIATALVRGETGTGKELVARALHEQGPRSAGPFVKVHCAALPDALLESELFGYEKGAFTGATSRKPGRVELAEGGTLFLDEIGDIKPAMQVKLLRLLQDKEYERLGGIASLRADVRFIAATHRDLEGMVKRSEFREDLFYRLNVVTLWLPPLRARRDDIPLLANEFAGEFARAHGKPGVRLDEGAIRALRHERWPGNVRQLQNFVERLVVLGVGPSITEDDVRREMTEQVQFKTQLTGGIGTHRSVGQLPSPDEPASSSRILPLDEAVREAERQALERALRHAGGNRTVAARILGVSRATVYTKMQEHGLK